MARIAFPDPAAMDDDLRESLRKLGSLNVTRMMAHQPRLMHAYARMGVEILRHGTIDPVLRELIILRVGQLCKSDYEHHQHVSVARMVGMSEAMLAASEANDRSTFSDRECAALAITDEIYRDNCASAETIKVAQALFSPAELVEICIVTGFYIMTAGYLRSLDIEVEDAPPLGDRMIQGERSAISN
ncbi:carboxymuconolactone decarboxylase family protein [Sphingomonas sp. CGMCC 1.13654]|uniref:Carboxymuconolactone decarboxylase family protein n=1 Tax=Sphingomonas chungangi TaxID=2683589 RepID=A0A838L8G1_9SPHN|nr:carboxymuconolactone decarboxylase family protein [Sphingomonas chungangi]MBA2933818.1 carboxymuconolactone decarboxylase family protein [Sphingomonas chungangi]MVW55148.1 hypothetical protein [Sphingomonas chungangi]